MPAALMALWHVRAAALTAAAVARRRGIQIAPDPTPGSDGHLQIGTAGGDGFGMGLSQKGPTIKNCVIQGTGGRTVSPPGWVGERGRPRPGDAC